MSQAEVFSETQERWLGPPNLQLIISLGGTETVGKKPSQFCFLPDKSCRSFHVHENIHCVNEGEQAHALTRRNRRVKENGSQVWEAVKLDILQQRQPPGLSWGKPWNKLICANESQKGLGVRAPRTFGRWVFMRGWRTARKSTGTAGVRALPVGGSSQPALSLLCVSASLNPSVSLSGFLSLSLSLSCLHLYFCIFAISRCLSVSPCICLSLWNFRVSPSRPSNSLFGPWSHQAQNQWLAHHFTHPGPFPGPGLWVRQIRVQDPKFSFVGDRVEPTQGIHKVAVKDYFSTFLPHLPLCRLRHSQGSGKRFWVSANLFKLEVFFKNQD